MTSRLKVKPRIQNLEVGWAIVGGEPAGEAGVVEVIVGAQVGVLGNAIKRARDVLGDAQAILVDQAVLLAGHAPAEPHGEAVEGKEGDEAHGRVNQPRRPVAAEADKPVPGPCLPLLL